jgi:hypothetical protein
MYGEILEVGADGWIIPIIGVPVVGVTGVSAACEKAFAKAPSVKIDAVARRACFDIMFILVWAAK